MIGGIGSHALFRLFHGFLNRSNDPDLFLVESATAMGTLVWLAMPMIDHVRTGVRRIAAFGLWVLCAPFAYVTCHRICITLADRVFVAMPECFTHQGSSGAAIVLAVLAFLVSGTWPALPSCGSQSAYPEQPLLAPAQGPKDDLGSPSEVETARSPPGDANEKRSLSAWALKLIEILELARTSTVPGIDRIHDRYFSTTMSDIATLLHCAKSTAHAATNQLAAADIITVERGRHGTRIRFERSGTG
jgi:hypothetical protein